MKKVFLAIMLAGFSFLLTACGGGSSDTNAVVPTPTPSPTPTPATVTYSIGGTTSGLNGSLTVKNNSTDQLIISSSGTFTFTTPINQGGQYNVTITAQPNSQTCVLSNASGTNVTANVTSISISCTNNSPGTTSLSLSTSTLALKTSGVVRTFIVTNTGQNPALNIIVSTSPTLPTGTTKSSTCSASLAPASSCNITISPGSTASPVASAGTAALPSVFTIAGSNTNSLNANVYILAYGSIYQSGYLFSIDDSTASTSSIGGKVLALSDQSGPSQWSTTYINLGISEDTSSPCNGAYDGNCDTTQIVSSYLTTPYSNYAAGLCKSTINGYGDWYLPAICELNKAPTYTPAICNAATQDIQSNLVDSSIVSLNGYYWSSTEYSVNPTNSAWLNYFASGGGGTPLLAFKSFQLAVRCVRSLSN